MRTFIAAPLPDEVRKNIVELINELKEVGSGAGGERSRAVKWVEEKNLHITLKFLGWVEEKKVDNLISLVAGAVAGTGGFKAKFEGMGTFPPGKSPRVIWVGTTEGGDKLKQLADSLEENLSKAGYRSEEREFSSHITIGRVKNDEGVDKLLEKIGEFKDPKFGETVIDSINIMKSTLSPTGPVYENIKEVKL